jgi:hypothetical protein
MVKWSPQKKKKKNRGAAIFSPHLLHEPKAILKALGLPVHGSIGRFSHNNITIN